MIVKPTHSCFDDALDYIYDTCSLDPSRMHSMVLVHGICQSENNEPYAHAWVEEKGEAHFFGIVKGVRMLFMVPLDEFLEKFQVVECKRYSVPQAIRLNAYYKNYGPWIEKYRRLCRNGK